MTGFCFVCSQPVVIDEASDHVLREAERAVWRAPGQHALTQRKPAKQVRRRQSRETIWLRVLGGAVFCTYCGAKISGDAQFCSACGRPLIPAAQPGGGPAPSLPPQAVMIAAGTEPGKLLALFLDEQRLHD